MIRLAAQTDHRIPTASPRIVWGWLFLFSCLVISPALSQDDYDDEDAVTPGLIAEYATIRRQGKAVVPGGALRAIEPDVIFVWDRVPTQRLEPGKEFSVTLTSSLLVQQASKYRLHVVVEGDVQIELDDEEPVLRATSDKPKLMSGEPFDLAFGDHKIVIRYRSQPKGTGTLKLYWSSDAFSMEPIPAHLFSIEDPPDWFLAIAKMESPSHHTAFRCARCHDSAGDRKYESSPFADTDPAPSLTSIREGLSKDWIVSKLTTKPTHGDGTKMPWFKLDKQGAEDVAAFLLRGAKKPKFQKTPKSKNVEADRKGGQRLVQTLGCLACHSLDDVGTQGLYSGGQLSDVKSKRSVDWVYTWLAKPESLNADHRMPVIDLSKDERRQLAIFLGGPAISKPTKAESERTRRGEAIIRESNCANCHRISGVEPTSLKAIDAIVKERLQTDAAARGDRNRRFDLQGSNCVSPAPDHRGPRYSQASQKVLEWHQAFRLKPTTFVTGQHLLERRNCTACHQRDGSGGNLDVVGQLVKSDRSLRTQSQGLIPPALTAIGDKLKDDALRKAISGEQKRRLPWLSVRMPKFKHSKVESDALVSYLIEHDRIPIKETEENREVTTQTLVEGQTLIGSGGFSCIACHKAGKYEPRNLALGTRGSDLLMPGERMRKEFFLRWVRSPTRIVPGMEMPSITKPVKGVLDDDIHNQLAAAWDVLNDKNFTVPTNPGSFEQFVRVEPKAPARIIRDVFTDPAGNGYIARPIVIGLNNGHNVMFDLDQFGFRHWWFGDVARQRTEGKSWYWDVAGITVASVRTGSDIVLRTRNGKIVKPTIDRATAGRVSQVESHRNGVVVAYSLNFTLDGKPTSLRVTERIEPYSFVDKVNGWRRIVAIRNLPAGHDALVRMFEADDIETIVDNKRFEHDGHAYLVFANGKCDVGFLSELKRTPTKRLPTTPELINDADEITSVPGFIGNRLPLPASIMPTSMTWRRDGTFVFTSLKGHVYLATDADGDDLPDTLSVFEEGLAAPFGILRAIPDDHAVVSNDLLVAHKPEILRLSGRESAVERTVVSTGWGYSDNYHDWTCGLVRDSKGYIYFGLGSDYSQPKRPKDRSLWRGAVLRMAPGGGRTEPVSWSFRYPVGFAIDNKDRVFVTDNQGVQNTFNEVNHLQMGKHYGVPSMHEPNPDQPETTPALRVPHPWVRSMNAILFLPECHKSGFGGHLIGAEYDTHMLIRMSFQTVGEVVQGASYYFSKPGLEGGGHNFVGPICAAVHKNGDIYVGSIHDSGWLGGRNTGAIERIRFSGNLPNGIRELRATSDGFEIDFVKPLPTDKLSNTDNYSISGYTRNWKGSYATPDSGRHTLNITKAQATSEGQTVRLTVEQDLRKEHVYEVTVSAAKDLFPATGHYTMKRVPK